MHPGRRMLARLAGRSAQALNRVQGGLADLERLTRFVRGHLEFEPRPDDVFLASYPRSGTTWLQMILYQLTTPGRLDFEHIGQVIPWYERSLAVGSARATDFEALSSPRVFKSHLLPGWLPRPARFIYIQRDGLDVALSYYHLYRTHLGYGGDFDAFYKRFLTGRLQYKSWFDHLAAWERLRGEPGVLFLRFEDLRSDTARQVERLAGFLQISLDDNKLARVLERSELTFMKERHEKFDHLTALMHERGWRPGAFIRDGSVGTGQKRLTPRQVERFRSRLRSANGSTSAPWDLFAFLH